MCYLFIPQEMQEARKSFSKKDEEYIPSGRDKRLAEQVSSYNVSQNKMHNLAFFFLHLLMLFSFFSLFLVSLSFICFSSQSFSIHLF